MIFYGLRFSTNCNTAWYTHGASAIRDTEELCVACKKKSYVMRATEPSLSSRVWQASHAFSHAKGGYPLMMSLVGKRVVSQRPLERGVRPKARWLAMGAMEALTVPHYLGFKFLKLRRKITT